jgi:hypothetical protein
MDQIESTNIISQDADIDSLGEKIRKIIDQMPPEFVTLNEIIQIIGPDSLLLVTMFLSLVFLIPVSIPGVSTVFGFGILIIGFTRLFKRNLWLPDRIAKRNLSSEKLTVSMTKALKWFDRLEKISVSHRLPWMTAEGIIGIINKLSFILGALLLMVPFGLVPFSNTLPAIALIFLAIGLIQKDGICILLGHVSNIATIIYFIILLAIAYGGGMGIYGIINLIKGG